MRGRYISVLLVMPFLFICFLTGCKDDTAHTYRLQVTSYRWNGWDADYVPEEEVDLLDITAGERYTIPGFTEDTMELKVKRVSDKGLTFVTSEELCTGTETGTIYMDELLTAFTVNAEEKLILYQPSLDEGMVYEFELMPSEE